MTRGRRVWKTGLVGICAAVSYQACGEPKPYLGAAEEAPVFDTLPAPKPATRGEAERKTKPSATQPAGTPQKPASTSSEAKTAPRSLPIDRQKPLDQFLRIGSEVDAGLMCAARSGAEPTESDYENFATIQSAEYRSASDTIAKRKILESLKREMREKFEAFKRNPYFVITRGFYLEHYDSTKHAFPVVATQGIPVSWLMEGRISYFARTSNYILRMSNAQNFAEYKVADEKQAQELEARPPGDRGGQGWLYLFARDTEPGSQTIRAEIVKARLFDRGKDLIAELEG